MTDYVVNIEVDSQGVARGVRSAEGQFNRLDRRVRRSSQTLNTFGQIFGTIFTGAALVGVGRAADQYTEFGNRIRLVTDSQSEFNTVFDELVGVAANTRSSLESTVTLYGRVARSLDQINASQDEAIRLTELVNQTFLISGATAQEATASTIQFAQGLASGALRGEELRSVLEGNQRLSIALADSLGVTVGQLRELGAAGELNVQNFLPGLLDQAEAINAEFEKTTPTLSQTITVIRNFATIAVGAFNETAGITEGLVDIFSLTGEQAQDLRRELEDAGLAFREFVEVAVVAVVSFADTVAPRFEQVRTEIVKIIAALTRDEDLFREAFAGQAEAGEAIDEIKNRLIEELDAIRRNNDARRDAIELRREEADLTQKGGGGGSAFQIDQDAVDDLESLKRSLEDSVEAYAAAATGAVTYDQALQAIEIRSLAAAGGSGALAAEIFDLIDAENEAAEAAQTLADAQGRAADIIEETRTPLENYIAGVREAQDLFARGLIDEEVLQRQIVNLQAGLEEADGEISDFARRARENTQDLLADFFSGGFADIDEFGRRFIQTILEIQAQALAANIAESLIGSGGGGFGGFLSVVFGGARAQGGPVNPNQAFLVGERGPELFVPPGQGSIVDARNTEAAMQAPAPVVNVSPQIINTLDDADIVGAINRGGGDVILNKVTENAAAFRQALGI